MGPQNRALPDSRPAEPADSQTANRCDQGSAAKRMKPSTGGEHTAIRCILQEVLELGRLPKEISNPKTDAEKVKYVTMSHVEHASRKKCFVTPCRPFPEGQKWKCTFAFALSALQCSSEKRH